MGVLDGTEPGVAESWSATPGVEHAFFWPGTPPFSREDAWRRIVELLAS